MFTRMIVAAASHGLLRIEHSPVTWPGSAALRYIRACLRCSLLPGLVVIICAAGVIAVHHLLFNYLQQIHYQVWGFQTSPTLSSCLSTLPMW